MAINKSQGQTFSKFGIYLDRACFPHGQLYVAFSRCKSFEGISISIKNDKNQGKHKENWHTQNVVFQPVLDSCEFTNQDNMSNKTCSLENLLNSAASLDDNHILSTDCGSNSKIDMNVSISESMQYAFVVENEYSDLNDNQYNFNSSNNSVDFHIIRPHNITGLINDGNKCYIISIIQVLRSIRQGVINTNSIVQSDLAIVFQELMLSMDNSENVPLVPFVFYKAYKLHWVTL